MSKLSDDSEKMHAKGLRFYNIRLPEYLAAKLIENTDDAFDNEQYPGKTKWEGLSPKWKKYREKEDQSLSRTSRGGTLVKSGDLRKSIETDYKNGQASIGTDLEWSKIHNEGLQGKVFGKHAFTMPERKFMPVEGDDLPFQNEVDQFVDKHMKEILGQ